MCKIKCLRCEGEMHCIGTEKIQLGQTGWFLRDLPNLLAGALEVEIYSCKVCGKIEFFQSETASVNASIATTKCPKCGKIHDIDCPKCPFCKYDYYTKQG